MKTSQPHTMEKHIDVFVCSINTVSANTRLSETVIGLCHAVGTHSWENMDPT